MVESDEAARELSVPMSSLRRRLKQLWQTSTIRCRSFFLGSRRLLSVSWRRLTTWVISRGTRWYADAAPAAVRVGARVPVYPMRRIVAADSDGAQYVIKRLAAMNVGRGHD